MWNATEGTVWRMGCVGAIILCVLAACLWGMATNNDAGSAAAVTSAPVEVEVTEEPTIDVGDDGANQIIDDTLEVLNSANSVLACTRQYNAKELTFGEYCKCMANSEPDDSTVSPELQGCLDWCEGCYVAADVTLNAGCTINETHLSGCYTHCVSEYGE